MLEQVGGAQLQVLGGLRDAHGAVSFGDALVGLDLGRLKRDPLGLLAHLPAEALVLFGLVGGEAQGLGEGLRQGGRRPIPQFGLHRVEPLDVGLLEHRSGRSGEAHHEEREAVLRHRDVRGRLAG